MTLIGGHRNRAQLGHGSGGQPILFGALPPEGRLADSRFAGHQHGCTVTAASPPGGLVPPGELLVPLRDIHGPMVKAG